jgi:predicted dehydrogenase
VSTLRAILLGAGAGIATAHVRALSHVGAQIVAVQDINPDRAALAAEQTGAPAYTEVEQALSAAADLVVVLAPHPFHAPLVITALEAGYHVLVEKPIADSVGQADKMAAAARRADRLLGVALQHRTRREVQAAAEFIKSGGLGALQRADLIGAWPRKRSYFEAAPWRGTWHGEGGGVVVNQGQHDLDLLTYLAGSPLHVVAWARTRLHDIETEDSVVAMLEWANGALGSVHLSTCEVDQSQRLELTGTGGRLRLLHGRLEIIQNEVDFRKYVDTVGDPYAPPPTRPLRAVEVSDDFDHTPIYRNFIDAIAGRAPLIAPAAAATATLELANAMLFSSANDTAVTLPLDRAAYTAFLADCRAASPHADLANLSRDANER